MNGEEQGGAMIAKVAVMQYQLESAMEEVRALREGKASVDRVDSLEQRMNTFKSEFDGLAPDLRAIVRDRNETQASRLALWRDIVKWATMLLLAVIGGSVLYALGIADNPFTR